ncbi:MAG TPA: hypothetical protein VL128_04575 [Candidatus Eisenbacteria bacterium]|nr:hypothetical protein [Candidatus Eisenbacteria bacterium]
MRSLRFEKMKRSRREEGIALLTTLLLLFLMSSLLVGFSVLLYSNQKLAGSNDQQVRSFYAAEAGMEQLTAGLGNLFDLTYSPSISQIDTLETTPPSIPGITYTKADGSSGYLITPSAVDANGNPAPSINTITSGAYQGMTAMATTYTLMVNARTTTGQEVTLKRTTQTVGIPMFQFGIWSDSDLDFFPGPNFNFGGRTHTNGNLFLAAGSTLTMSDKVDAYKDVIRYELENGHPTSSGYTGTVNITVAPGGGTYRALGAGEGSILSGLGTGSPTPNTNWPQISLGSAPTHYAGNLQNGAGSAAKQYAGSSKQLDLGIVTVGGGSTQQIDLIRRPAQGESSNVTGERYFAQASLRVLLSDNSADLTNLPCEDNGTAPFNLSHIAVAPGVGGANWNAYTDSAALYLAMTAKGVTPLPLAASGSTGGAAWAASDGYMQPNGYPIVKGFLKIEEQTAYGSPCGTWKDVTIEVLSYGYVGRNINPVPQSFDNSTLNPEWTGTTAQMQLGAAPSITNVPMNGANPIQMNFQNGPVFPKTTATTAVFTAINSAAAPTYNCPDPHPMAVIRLERVRDNPSSVPYTSGTRKTTSPKNLPVTSTVGQVCGVEPSTGNLVAGWTPKPYDFWPNTLFDTREGTIRDIAMDPVATQPQRPTLNGVMQYVEIDGKNLASWFAGSLKNPYTGTSYATSGPSTEDPVVAPNDFVVYVSDRRGNYTAGKVTSAWPPLSFTGNESGEYGWNDIVNSSNATTGCPNNTLETGEDVDGNNVFFTYGAEAKWIHDAGDTQANIINNGQLGVFNNLATSGAFANPVNCTTVPAYSKTDNIWPFLLAANAATARENPPLFFRRAVKIVNAANLTAVGTCPGGVSCGLTISAENPVYIQGDFNANSAGGGWNDPTIATSIAGDAVTLLSDNWNDVNSFASPYSQSARQGNTTWYRTAIIGGITVPFPQPTGTAQDFGTDGGVHNFLRYLESWSGTLEYQGSIIQLFTSRQANSTFKCCTTVYNPPTRGYNFDVNFLNPTLLPPRTPLFRDVNTTGWTRLLLPGQYN